MPVHAIDENSPAPDDDFGCIVGKAWTNAGRHISNPRLPERWKERIGGRHKLRCRTQCRSAVIVALNHSRADHETAPRPGHYIERDAGMKQANWTVKRCPTIFQDDPLTANASQCLEFVARCQSPAVYNPICVRPALARDW